MRVEGRILGQRGWCLGHLEWVDGKIAAIHPDDGLDAEGCPWVLPGFIDLHVHGGGGSDSMQAGDAAAVLARTHAGFGTTSLLVTTMTANDQAICAALSAVAEVMAGPPTDGADILGVHLEGPFISPDKLGAQPAYARPGSIGELRRYMALAPIRVVTLAPEISGHLELIQYLRQQGVRVQIGHTCAAYEMCRQALERGASGFTHLFNAMSPLAHRAPGAAAAALAHAEFCEVVADLIHVEKGALLAAMRAIPRLYGVTDATAATGMPDGQYLLGENQVFKHAGAVRLADGTLAGSTLTLDQALRNFVALGDSLERACWRVSGWPAQYLGVADRGLLEPGRRADLVVLDRDLQVKQVYVAGRSIPVHGQS